MSLIVEYPDGSTQKFSDMAAVKAEAKVFLSGQPLVELPVYQLSSVIRAETRIVVDKPRPTQLRCSPEVQA